MADIREWDRWAALWGGRTVRKRGCTNDTRYVRRGRGAVVGREDVQPRRQNDGDKLGVVLDVLGDVGCAEWHVDSDTREDCEVGQRKTETVTVLIARRIVLALCHADVE